MKNKMFWFISLMFLILFIVGICEIDGNDKFMFFVYLLTAYGTCSVTVLNIFPFKHYDNISATMYWKKDYLFAGENINVLQIKVENKRDQEVVLLDKVLVWNSDINDFNEDKAYSFRLGGEKFYEGKIILLPKSIYYINYEEKDFNNMNITNINTIKIKLITSTGQKFDVENKI